MVFSWRQFCLALTRAVKPGTKRKIQGMIAKSFAAKVEKLHGAKSAANSPSAKTKLVEAKLDVVRAGWLLQHVGIVGRLCCFDRVDRVQRDEIHRRLQRRFDPGPGAPFCNRGSRIADQRGISSLWKYERERRIRGSEPVDSHFRPKWKRDHLRGSNQVARSMELFGSHRRDHKNASAYRSSPQPRSSRFAVTTSVQPAKKKLPVSAILFGILAGIIGVAAGLFLGFALGAALAAAFHVSTFEGEAGYFAAAIALLVTCIVAPGLILLTLYWRGARGLWLFAGLIAVSLSLGLIAVSGFGIWYAGQPHVLNINGPTPLLEFEVKPPAGQSVENLTNVQPELDTDRNAMPGYWHTEAPENPGVRAGYVELYFRTSQRLFVLKFPGDTDRIFQLKLPANPMRSKYRVWSDWQNPDFVAKRGEQPSHPSGGNEYQIRYKMDYQEP